MSEHEATYAISRAADLAMHMARTQRVSEPSARELLAWLDEARENLSIGVDWAALILKADAASDRERALATLANMVRTGTDPNIARELTDEERESFAPGREL